MSVVGVPLIVDPLPVRPISLMLFHLYSTDEDIRTHCKHKDSLKSHATNSGVGESL